jgi:hypothetical protein
MDAASVVINLAWQVYFVCEDAAEKRGTLKVTGQKMQGLAQLLDSLPAHCYSQQEVSFFLEETNDEVKQILTLVSKATRLDEVVYVLQAKRIKYDLDKILTNINLSLQSLDIAETELLRQNLESSCWNRPDDTATRLALDIAETELLRKNLESSDWNRPDDTATRLALDKEKAARRELLQVLQETSESLKRENIARMAGITTVDRKDALLEQVRHEIGELQAELHQAKSRASRGKAQLQVDQMNQLLSAVNLVQFQQPAPDEEEAEWTICPVSLEVMKDPVIVDAMCLHTCDRSSFDEWIDKGGKTCPICGVNLRSKRAQPNTHLRDAISMTVPPTANITMPMKVARMPADISMTVPPTANIPMPMKVTRMFADIEVSLPRGKLSEYESAETDLRTMLLKNPATRMLPRREASF